MTNVSPNEIHTFDSVSQDWWQPNGAFKTLHDINPLRLSFITQQVDLQQQRILDVGCGGGILAESMAAIGADVTGIDMSEAALDAAKQHAKENHLQIHYEKITVEEMAERHPQQFDVVTCMEMLEHVPDPAAVVTACAQLLKPSGRLFFSTLNRNLKSYLFAIVGAEYILKLLPRGLHHYEQFIRPAELATWVRQAGLEVNQMMGLRYDPFSKQFSLTPNVDVNYLVSCRYG